MLETKVLILLIITLIQFIELFFCDAKNSLAVLLSCTGNIEARTTVLKLKLAKKPWNKINISFVAFWTVVTMVLKHNSFFAVRIWAGLVKKLVWNLHQKSHQILKRGWVVWQVLFNKQLSFILDLIYIWKCNGFGTDIIVRQILHVLIISMRSQLQYQKLFGSLKLGQVCDHLAWGSHIKLLLFLVLSELQILKQNNISFRKIGHFHSLVPSCDIYSKILISNYEDSFFLFLASLICKLLNLVDLD